MGSRSASGESSIYKDKTGRWHGYVSMGLKENGRRDRRHVSAARRADVVAKVRALEIKRDAGTAEAAGRPSTVGDWLDHWLEHIAPHRVRARTLESYGALVRLHLRPAARSPPAGSAAAGAPRAAVRLAARGQGPLARDRAPLAPRPVSRPARRHATREGRSQCGDPRRPAGGQAPGDCTPANGGRSAQRAAGRRAGANAARWTVALAVGLRQSEALGLRWSDIDLAVGTLTVRRGAHRVAGKGLVYEEPKAERSRRTLALPTPLVEALRRHNTVQLAEREAAGSLWEQEHDLVFAQINGRTVDKRSDWESWKALLRRAGVREVRLHDGRHTAATLLLSEGVHPRVVMELLGHAQMGTTTDTYSHVMPALAKEAAERMGAALWG